MSLKEELAKSKKLSSAFRRAVEELADDVDTRKPLFDVVVGVNGLPPVETFLNLSLEDIKELVDQPRIRRIESSVPLYPEKGKH